MVFFIALLIGACTSAKDAQVPTSGGSASRPAAAIPTWKPSDSVGDIEATVVVKPAQSPGTKGAPCGGSGKYRELQYGYQINFTAIYGTIHYAFLGDGLHAVDVAWHPATSACWFGLLLPPAKDGPFKISISGHEFDVTTNQAAWPIVLALP